MSVQQKTKAPFFFPFLSLSALQAEAKTHGPHKVVSIKSCDNVRISPHHRVLLFNAAKPQT